MESRRSVWSKLTLLLCTAALLSGMLTLFMGTAVSGGCTVVQSEYIGCCGTFVGRYLQLCEGGGWQIVCTGRCMGPPP